MRALFAVSKCILHYLCAFFFWFCINLQNWLCSTFSWATFKVKHLFWHWTNSKHDAKAPTFLISWNTSDMGDWTESVLHRWQKRPQVGVLNQRQEQMACSDEVINYWFSDDLQSRMTPVFQLNASVPLHSLCLLNSASNVSSTLIYLLTVKYGR